MKKVMIVLTFLLLLPVASANHDDFEISSVRLNDFVNPGYTVDIQVTLEKKLSEWDIFVVVPELGLSARSFDRYLSKSGHVTLTIPYGTPRGDYLTRIFVHHEEDDEASDTKVRHRIISVI